MDGGDDAVSAWYTTGRLAALTGYSVQQIRDLERLGVIPPALRQVNGYRQFTATHATALGAYRQLAIAVGPVTARETMTDLHRLPYEEAVATIVALHTGLARSRAEVRAALSALDDIVAEHHSEAPPVPADFMSITELSAALGVRASTLRFWDRQGLITPERSEHSNSRRYSPGAINDARIVTALRAGGYRIPAVHATMATLRTVDDPRHASAVLAARLQTIAAQSEALLLAGTDLVRLLGARSDR